MIKVFVIVFMIWLTDGGEFNTISTKLATDYTTLEDCREFYLYQELNDARLSVMKSLDYHSMVTITGTCVVQLPAKKKEKAT